VLKETDLVVVLLSCVDRSFSRRAGGAGFMYLRQVLAHASGTNGHEASPAQCTVIVFASAVTGSIRALLDRKV
jgi:hypothetical protein